MASMSYASVLADLRRRRDELDAAIRAIAPLAGEAVDETILAAPASEPPVRESKRAPRATKGATGETARPTKASLGADSAEAKRVLAALESGPMGPAALEAKTELSSYYLRMALSALGTARLIRKSGATNTTKYFLDQA